MNFSLLLCKNGSFQHLTVIRERMEKNSTKYSRSLWKKIVYLSILAVSILLVLLILLLLCMPWIVCSSWVQEMVSSRASQAIGRKVHMDSLAFGWSRGLEFQGIRLAKNNGFNQKAPLTLNRINISPQWKDLLEKRLSVHIRIVDLDLGYVQKKDGSSNWDFLFKNPGKKRVSEEESPGKAVPGPVELNLPLDIGLELDMQGFSLHAADLGSGRSLSLQNGSVSLDMPSLYQEAIGLQILASPRINQEPVSKLSLDLQVRDLVRDKGVIDPGNAYLGLAAEAPGSSVQIHGDLGKKGVNCSMHLQPAELIAAADPFLPDSVPEMRGDIRIRSDAAYRSKQDMQANLDLNATGLSVSGSGYPGISGDMGLSVRAAGNPAKDLDFRIFCLASDLRGDISDKRFGRMRFALSQNGTYYHAGQDLELSSGKLALQEHGYLRWKGGISSLFDKHPSFDLEIGKAKLQLWEILEPVSAFLPENLPLELKEHAPGILKIRELGMRGKPPPGDQSVELDSLKLSLPGIQIRDKISSAELTLGLNNSTIKMQSMFPVRVESDLRLLAENLLLQGDKDISIRSLDIPLDLNARNMNKKEDSLLGVTGSLGIRQEAGLQGVALQDRADISSLKNSLQLDLQIRDSSCLLALRDFRLFSPEVDLFLGKENAVRTGLDTQISGDLALNSLDPLDADITGVNFETLLGDSLEMNCEISARDLGMEQIRSQGDIRFDSRGLQPLLREFLPAEAEYTGHSKIVWDIDGNIPGDGEIASLSNGTLPLRQRLLDVGFLQGLELDLFARGVDLDWPLAGNAPVELEGLNTRDRFSISLQQGFRQAELSTEISVEKIKNLPGMETLQSPPGLNFTLNSSVADLKDLRLREKLQLEPLSLTQSLQIQLQDFTALLRPGDKKLLPKLLSDMQGSLSAGLQADLGDEPKELAPGVKVGKQVRTNLNARLQGSERLGIGFELASPGLGLYLWDTASIRDFQSDLRLSGSYGIKTGETSKKAGEKTLSRQVLSPPGDKRKPTFAGRGWGKRNLPYWARYFGIKPDISIAECQLQGMPLPVRISNFRMETAQNQGIPGIERFQLDLWSGSLLGKARIMPGDDGFYLDTACSFSGVDAAAALPDSVNLPRGSDTQISGRFGLDVPVAGSIDKMLNNLYLNLDLTHIGSRTLRKFLYAMDPTGNNEAIVQQRKLLDTARPQRINLKVEQGNLSLTGRAAVKGVGIEIPPVRRFQISKLPVQKQLSNLEVPLDSIREVLSVLAAEEIVVSPEDKVRLVP